MNRALVIPLIIALGIPAGAAALKPTPEMRRHCGPEAKKFCASVISNPAKRQACMRAHWKKVSKDCKAAVAKARKKS